MSIKREDLDAGRIDFADVTTGKKLPPIHPGEILRDDFLKPMKISVYALAQAIKVPRSRVNDIVLGRRGITADTAFRLARYFGTSPEFWINLQARHDLDVADQGHAWRQAESCLSILWQALPRGHFSVGGSCHPRSAWEQEHLFGVRMRCLQSNVWPRYRERLWQLVEADADPRKNSWETWHSLLKERIERRVTN